MTEINLISKTEIQRVADCLSNAIGDDLKEDLRLQGIDENRANSKPYRKWDLINRNFVREFPGIELKADYARRCGWNMVPLFDEKQGCIYMLMREDRYKQLHKTQNQRHNAHYMDAFTKSFNFDIHENKQCSLFDEPQFKESAIEKIVEDILADLHVPRARVRRHAVILFDEINYELTTMRCCILNSSLDVVDQENWSSYIKLDDSVIIDVINDKDDEINHGTKLVFTKKAKEKIGQPNQSKIKKENSKEKKNE